MLNRLEYTLALIPQATNTTAEFLKQFNLLLAVHNRHAGNT